MIDSNSSTDNLVINKIINPQDITANHKMLCTSHKSVAVVLYVNNHWDSYIAACEEHIVSRQPNRNVPQTARNTSVSNIFKSTVQIMIVE